MIKMEAFAEILWKQPVLTGPTIDSLMEVERFPKMMANIILNKQVFFLHQDLIKFLTQFTLHIQMDLLHGGETECFMALVFPAIIMTFPTTTCAYHSG